MCSVIGMFNFLKNLFQGQKEKDQDIFQPEMLFVTLSQRLKECVEGLDLKQIRKDYLSKEQNVEKYIYEACEQLQTYGVSYGRWKKELSGYSKEDLTKGVGGFVVRSYEREARLTLRRALELFIESWHFSRIDSGLDSEIRHYFLIRNLKAFDKRKDQLDEYCDYTSSWDERVIEQIKNELEQLEDPEKDYFYRQAGKDWRNDSDLRHYTKGFGSLVRSALPNMSEREQKAVGSSYEIYSESSEVIHGYSGGPEFKLDNPNHDLHILYGRVFLLAAPIIKNLATIGRNVLNCPDLIEAIFNLETDDLPDSLKIQKGDWVLVRGQVRAIVSEVNISQYGCEKYTVEYKDKRGDWSLQFDDTELLRHEIEKISAPENTPPTEDSQ